jgi:hypothetical protein
MPLGTLLSGILQGRTARRNTAATRADIGPPVKIRPNAS